MIINLFYHQFLEVVHDGLENKIVEQHKSSDQSTTNLQNNLHERPIHHNNDQSQSSDQSTTNLQNNLHERPIHHNNDQSQSQSQSTLSPNSGQSTIGNP